MKNGEERVAPARRPIPVEQKRADSPTEVIWDDRRLPVLMVAGKPEQRGPLDVLLRLLAGLALLFVVALLGVLLFVAIGVAGGVTGAGSLLGGAGDAVTRAGAGVQRMAQDVVDTMDPAHPPRVALAQDTEFDELRVVSGGDVLGKAGEYVLAVAEIRKREGAAAPAEAQYAIVHRQYEKPRETRVLGQVIHVDRGEADYYLYKGESFRLGRAYYRVNWVSFEQRQVAIARYRNVDDVTAAPKFQLD